MNKMHPSDFMKNADELEEDLSNSSNDYSSELMMVDMEDIDRSEYLADEDENELMIDCEDDDNSTSVPVERTISDNSDNGYDPLSLVSVGLDDDDDVDDEELSFDEEISNEVNTKCPFCSRLFSNRQLLNRHIRTVHQKSCSVTCQFCGRILNDEDSYRRHVASVHKGRYSL